MLIGNTDRHPENWGVLFTLLDRERLPAKMSPLFDNGTSLSYEIRDAELSSKWPQRRIEQYLARGTHHCTLSDADRKGCKHVELCIAFRDAYPATSAAMRSVIQLSDAQVEDAVHFCTTFDGPVTFSAERAEFVVRLIRIRRDQLAHALGE
jgi:hypothetical protein